MWEEFSRVMGVREGAGGDSADFTVTELNNVDSNKVYLGELSARALNKTKGIHDTKNPFPAPIQTARELFTDLHDRNCVHVEFNVEGSGLTYQHGDHVGIWPSNPDIEVARLLCALGLYDKRDTVIGIESLDPALAKVPFPVPTTYATVLRHYIDISTVAGRQILNILARFSPNPVAASELSKIGSDKEYYSLVVGKPCLKLGEVLQLVTGDDISGVPSTSTVTPWNIPFDVIVSAVPRLQARYYSISSSPKIHPQSIHVTCVVLKYQSESSPKTNAKWVFGVGSNYLLDLRMATHGEKAPPMVANGDAKPASVSNPTYAIAGPRNAYAVDSIYKAPIHVRRSTFRLPTNPKIPILMVGPGTGVAPFRGFVQERVALARKALEKNGPDALETWGQFLLYYGCRAENEDFLYKRTQGQIRLTHCVFSIWPRKPDGSKIYVQDLMWEDRENIAKIVGEQKEV
ncbi:hypothetical protein BS47DRAFT_1339960 [Hydnum rufescens UP504]|uniref:NADPH--hemoprotein reductase n=1 Tax=Hydnum rufescens UP504 TaxID=1448309 RepID=A0A9P6B3V5_9AGAM|nr:hypothetical protein BS47DRAFT_1339960 [Hydnum rufescens UP504]